MPKPVCTRCHREMYTTNLGTRIIFMAFDPPRPYKAYNCDEWECDNCDSTVVSGYGGLPFWIAGDSPEKLVINESEDIVVYEKGSGYA